MSREEKLWNLFCVAIGNYRSAESTLIFESNANIQYQLNKLDEEVKKMADEFEEALRQPPADQWIPCSLATPKPFNTVLVTYDDRGSVDCLHLEYDNKWHDDGWLVFEQSEILAWMPLPEPYKGVE